MKPKVIVIGGGAAGFFSAISVTEHFSNAEVILLEKTSKLLSKVKISGGGRCNVTHACFQLKELLLNYPRGQKELRKVFNQWMPQDTIDWFEDHGLLLKTEEDNRIFPISDDSQSVIDCLLKTAQKLKVQIRIGAEVTQITSIDNQFQIKLKNQETILADKVIVTTGGSPKLRGLHFIAPLGLEIIPPVPSLFTFNLPEENIKEIPGISIPKVKVRIQGVKLQEEGSLLITHWGLSAFAILRLSAWGARILHDLDYQASVSIQWLADRNEETIRQQLPHFQEEFKQRLIKNKNPFSLPQRLWQFLINRWQIPEEKPWQELSKKEKNRLMNGLMNDNYQMNGKTTFKEEFVTCGGVSRAEINFNTMESKKYKGLFFAGEVLDIDGLTGGFNFQAAWATGYVAGKNILESMKEI